MSFEEQFPELANYNIRDFIITIDLIEQHCLSKQRVKEAFNKIKKEWNVTEDCDIPGDACREESLFNAVLEELGL